MIIRRSGSTTSPRDDPEPWTVILSQTAVYALKAALHLAEINDDEPVRVDDIARELGVPRNYLSKILHVLARAGLLQSTRGPGGGFRLARSPEDMMLSDFVDHFDDVAGEPHCLLGRAKCSDDDPCAAHAGWKHVATAVNSFFRETSLADLVRTDSLPFEE